MKWKMRNSKNKMNEKKMKIVVNNDLWRKNVRWLHLEALRSNAKFLLTPSNSKLYNKICHHIQKRTQKCTNNTNKRYSHMAQT